MNNVYNSQNYQPAPQFGPSGNQFPPFTNIILVDSLEQALRMPARMHSEMVYWNRYKDEIYRVYTDYTNGKQYMVLDVKLHQTPKIEDTDAKDSNELSALTEKIANIEKNLEVLNEKYNVDANAMATTNTATSTADAARNTAGTAGTAGTADASTKRV